MFPGVCHASGVTNLQSARHGSKSVNVARCAGSQDTNRANQTTHTIPAIAAVQMKYRLILVFSQSPNWIFEVSADRL